MNKWLPLFGVGFLLYWLAQQKAVAAPRTAPGTPTPSGSNTWDLNLPPVQAWPVCPAGQYYDPNLNMCMVAPGAAYVPPQQCNMSDSSGCPPGWET